MVWRRRFFLLAGGLFLFRLLFVNSLPLSGDEAYHWEWSRHLDWGYYDHPPLTPYLIRLSTLLLGDRIELAVRLPAILCLMAAACAAFILARELTRLAGGDDNTAGRAGFAAGAMLLVFPLHAGLGMYMSTDPALVAAWSLGLLFLTRALRGGRLRDWLAAGLAVGCAGLSKFLAVMIVPATGLFLLLDPGARRWWRRPGLYVMAAVAAACVAPFLVWNALNEWPTFRFNFVARHADAVRFRPEYLLTYVTSQLLIVLAPGLCVSFFKALRQALGRRRHDASGALRFLALTWLVPALAFLKTSLTRQVGLHWTAAYWVGGFVMLAVVAALAHARGERGVLSWPVRWSVPWRVAVAAFVLAQAAVHVPAAWMDALGRRLAEPGARPRFYQHAERFGWREFGAWVDATAAELASGKGDPAGVFVICPSYSLAATTAFYRPSKQSLHLWSGPCPYGESYRLWTDFTALKGRDALFVAKKARDAAREAQRLPAYFEEVGPVEERVIHRGGRPVRTFYLIRCRGFVGREPDFTQPPGAGGGTP